MRGLSAAPDAYEVGTERRIPNASAQVGNPYRGPQADYEVDSKAVPPPDTPLRLVIEPVNGGPKKPNP